MKHLFDKTDNFNRVEFWAATAIFIFLVFFHITSALGFGGIPVHGPAETFRAYFDYSFVSQLLRYTILYLSFIVLNFYVVPGIFRNENRWKVLWLIPALYIAVAIAFGVIDTYLKHAFQYRMGGPTGDYNLAFQKNFLYATWLLLIFSFYTVIKYASVYLLSHAEAIRARYKFITPNILTASVIWMIIMFLLLAGNADRKVATLWAIVIPFSIAYYSLSFHYLLPLAFSKKKPFRFYLWRTLFLLAIVFFPMFLIGAILTSSEDGGAVTSLFNSMIQLLIMLPLTWVLYKRHLTGREEIHSLRSELGQSNANIDFLRSQINPHFLFNALNTIYGTAIQEGAERTGEGVQRLGDMMRFMLQENLQEKIALSRELDYLNNYISLQRLRTDPVASIKVESEIEQPVSCVKIAPMLLIPFVENAFKHGISFREPSYITVNLEVRDQTLYFDVSNSKHTKGDNDPEGDKSGIGLANVKDRLKLLYPSGHELVIRETKKDFFIHLTLKLNGKG